MTFHEILLIIAAFAAGFATKVLLNIWAEHKVSFYREGWKSSNDQVHTCQLREAYRAGQDQARSERVIEAPTPYYWQ